MRSNKACGLLMAATAAAMLMAGCQKDTVTLKARITPFGNDKVTMSGATPQWQDGDEVCVNSLEEITTISVSGSTATMQVLAAALYKAVYPAEYVTNTYGNEFDLLLPSKQVYTTANGNQVVKAPMGAYSQSKYLEFTPLGALLSINISNDFTNDNNARPDIVVDSVRVTALNGTHLWGRAIVENITASDHKYVMTGDTVGNNSILLAGEGEDAGMNMPIAHGSTGTCYVFIPEVTGERFAISVYAHDASGFRYAFSHEQADNMSYLLRRAELASVGYSTDDAARTERFVPLGAVDGLFSISSTQQVFFSQGNLQWSCTGGGSTATFHNVNGDNTADGTWRFALHQYDVIGQNSGNTTALANGRATQSDWIDLFQRGCSGISIGSNNYYPYTLFSPACATDMANTNYDWGVYNAISNGGDTPGQWRTLTLGEWDYVITGRPSSLAKKATVNSVNGYILLPDNWSWDWDSDNSLSYIFTRDQADKRIFSDEQWRHMEKHGAVFLPNTPNPETEHKDNGDKIKTWENNKNYYWTTTTTPGDKADNTTHSAISLKVDKNAVSYDDNRFKTNELKHLCAVRLVQDYVAPTTNTTDE